MTLDMESLADAVEQYLHGKNLKGLEPQLPKVLHKILPTNSPFSLTKEQLIKALDAVGLDEHSVINQPSLKSFTPSKLMAIVEKMIAHGTCADEEYRQQLLQENQRTVSAQIAYCFKGKTDLPAEKLTPEDLKLIEESKPIGSNTRTKPKGERPKQENPAKQTLTPETDALTNEQTTHDETKKALESE
jgi:hypothetical protein